MPSLSIDLDSIELQDSGGWQSLPPGDYRVMITDSQLKPNSKGTGDVLTLFLQVLDGDGAGTEIRDYLSVRHQNETAQRIAQQTLKQIASAIGINGVLTDSAQLHGVPLRASITQVEADAGYGDADGMQNRVAGYSAAGDATVPAPKSAPMPDPEDAPIPF